MKSLENIFSAGGTKSDEAKCPNPRTAIIVDTREKQSLVATNLISKKAKVNFEKLEVGDYLVGEVLIERKTFSDFVGSMINKRLGEQLINLKRSEKCFLLLEGFDYDYEKFRVHRNAIKGMLICVAVDFGIPIIYTKDAEETSEFLILIARRIKEKECSKRLTKRFKTLGEQKQFILEGFPGIGPTTAKKLLGNFKNLSETFGASREKLKDAEMSDGAIEKFKEILEG